MICIQILTGSVANMIHLRNGHTGTTYAADMHRNDPEIWATLGPIMACLVSKREVSAGVYFQEYLA